jgi:hypothetical protein
MERLDWAPFDVFLALGGMKLLGWLKRREMGSHAANLQVELRFACTII